MKKYTLFLFSFFTLIYFVSCNSNQQTNQNNLAESDTLMNGDLVAHNMQVPYRVLDRYFVNGQMSEDGLFKLESEGQFQNLFSPASVMGENGIPYKIQFDKEFVIAVIMPETQMATEMVPVALLRTQDGDLLFTYKVNVGTEQSFSIRPYIAIIVEKQFNGNVIARREE